MPKPDVNLGISGGSHAKMTARMMMAMEDVFVEQKPDWVLVYGDMNSTLAAALTAAKLHIPICHVEAGIRGRVMTNPEEINRICTDHISSLRLTSTQIGLDNLIAENLAANSYFVGNTMYDTFLKYKDRLTPSEIRLTLLDGGESTLPARYYYLTCHREENTNDDKNLLGILNAMEQLEFPAIYPVHPRNKARARRLDGQYHFKNIMFVEPVGYLESLCLLNHAEKLVTDSGGLQAEAFFAKKKCVTILDFIVWPEVMIDNRNTLSAPIAEEILQKLSLEQKIDPSYQPFGDGHAGNKIVRHLEQGVN